MSIWMQSRHQRKLERAATVAAAIDRVMGDGHREYRVRFERGDWYAEYRERFFWHKLAESYAMDAWYKCKTRERALEVIAADKARIVNWAGTPSIEMVA